MSMAMAPMAAARRAGEAGRGTEVTTCRGEAGTREIKVSSGEGLSRRIICKAATGGGRVAVGGSTRGATEDAWRPLKLWRLSVARLRVRRLSLLRRLCMQPSVWAADGADANNPVPCGQRPGNGDTGQDAQRPSPAV